MRGLSQSQLSQQRMVAEGKTGTDSPFRALKEPQAEEPGTTRQCLTRAVIIVPNPSGHWNDSPHSDSDKSCSRHQSSGAEAFPFKQIGKEPAGYTFSAAETATFP